MRFKVDSIPDELRLKIHDKNSPVEGVLVRVTFFTSSKNDFHQIVGLSDKGGIISVFRAEIFSDAQKKVDFFPADYNPLSSVFSGNCSVEIMNEDAIGRALSAYSKFKNNYDYPVDFKDNLDCSLDLARSIKTENLSIEVVQKNTGGVANPTD